jgi:dolichol-phosphate mannosyltransferase
MTVVAIEEAIRALIAHLAGRTVPGWTSLMVVLCLSNAALMIAVGILGEYVGRIYEEGKGRPLYVVADTWNMPTVDRENVANLLSAPDDHGIAPPFVRTEKL